MSLSKQVFNRTRKGCFFVHHFYMLEKSSGNGFLLAGFYPSVNAQQTSWGGVFSG